MTEEMRGKLFRDLIDHGLRELFLHRDRVNDLNVFPVPDGDTGSNMLLTLMNGYNAIKGFEGDFGTLIDRFAEAIVFGARGNSGVILSQFFKGFSGRLRSAEDIGGEDFVCALESGVASAYKSVAKPVEGTMLTVMREAAEQVRKYFEAGGSGDLRSLNGVFLEAAKLSLENTPELLPVLKAAGVIDSGGAGLVYIFEGINKYLNNEEIEETAPEIEQEKTAPSLDFSEYDTASVFPLGYCTEVLLQLQEGKPQFNKDMLVEALSSVSESIVVSEQSSRVKIHAHSHHPERVLSVCHEYGEFLTLKIENMTVQHTEAHRVIEVSPQKKEGRIRVIAAADDRVMREKFFEMGADVVINTGMGYNPSAQDFVDACRILECKGILIFPNCKNSVFAAEQALELAGAEDSFVIDSRSPAQCYAALSIMDYESASAGEMAEEVCAAIEGIRTVSVSRAVKNAVYGEETIGKGEMIALFGGTMLSHGPSFTEVASKAVELIDSEEPFDVITLFFGEASSVREREELVAFIEDRFPCVDTDVIETGNELYGLIMSFE